MKQPAEAAQADQPLSATLIIILTLRQHAKAGEAGRNQEAVREMASFAHGPHSRRKM